MSGESFEKMSPLISILRSESYMHPGLADHRAYTLPFLGMGRREITEPILSFYRWRPEVQRVQATSPQSQSKPVTGRDHISLPTHTVQCYLHCSSYGKFFIFALWRDKKKRGGGSRILSFEILCRL